MSGKKRFRRAVAADLSAIVRLLAEDDLGKHREDASLPLNAKYIKAFRAIEDDPNQHMLVMMDNEAVIGCLQLTLIPGLTRLGMLRGQIEGVRVAKKYRGQGLGKELVEHAIAICREHGCGMVQLATDKLRTNAHPFYEKLGFVASHEGMKLVL